MTIVATSAGVVLIGLALRDLLHQLLHPSGSGALSRWVMHGLWRVLRALGPQNHWLLGVAGPVILVAVLVTWTLLLVTGWALVYWPRLPDQFRFASPLSPATHGGFDDAVYVSLVSLATLGFGDITATTAWLRFATAVEALVGFALLTVGISWVLLLYPVLTRRRALAQCVTLVGEAERRTGVRVTDRDAAAASRLLDQLAADVTTARVDLMLSPISYYFHDPERSVSLAAALPRLAELADAPSDDASPSVRHGAAMLRGAVDAFAALVGAAHLGLKGAPTGAVLQAYARDHPSPEGSA